MTPAKISLLIVVDCTVFLGLGLIIATMVR